VVSKTLDEVLAALDRLVDEHLEASVDPGPGADNFRCVDCRGCYSCRFCVSCLRCEECTYCEGCEDCRDCTQAKRLKGCVGCTHCEDCADCQSSHYLTLCIDCEDCVQCFACVGMSGEEFCVLNERYSRSEYFELVGALREELGARVAKGWRPEIVGLEAASVEQEEDGREDQPESLQSSPTSPSLTRAARPQRPGSTGSQADGQGESQMRAAQRPSRQGRE